MNFFDKKFFYFLLVFVFFYFASLIGFFNSTVQITCFFLIVGLFIFLAFWRFEYAVLFFLAEFLFGQAGHFFEYRNISLRSTLLILLILFWFFRKVIRKQPIEIFKEKIIWPFFLFLIFLIIAALRGYFIFNDKSLVLKDAISYSFFLAIFPLYEFFRKPVCQLRFLKILVAAVVGITIFTLFNLFLYSNQLSQVHDSYYWWLRNILIGKITAMGGGFFRVVFPSHLLMIPIFLIFFNCLLNNKLASKVKNQILLITILISLSILTNFSRIYFLSLIFGLCFLKIGLKWRKWLSVLILVLLVLVFEFILLYFLTTGRLIGGQVLLSRVETVVQPEEELSALTRLRILPDLKNKIASNFIFGTGLGSQVSYLDPLTNQYKTTFHIDWGWLELLLELGFFGLLSYLFFLGFIFYRLIRKIKFDRLYIGLLAGLATLLFANLTGPFLFHPLGILYQILIICLL